MENQNVIDIYTHIVVTHKQNVSELKTNFPVQSMSYSFLTLYNIWI